MLVYFLGGYSFCGFFFFFELGTKIFKSMCNMFLRLQFSQAFKLIYCAWEIDINMTLQLNIVVNVPMTQDQNSMLMNWIFNSTDLFMYFYYFCGKQNHGQWHWYIPRVKCSAAHSSSTAASGQLLCVPFSLAAALVKPFQCCVEGKLHISLNQP